MDVRSTTLEMKKNAPAMAAVSHRERINALEAVKEALVGNKKEIFEANMEDLSYAAYNGVPDSIIKRLKFDEGKLSSVLDGIDTLVKLKDPVGEVSLHRMLDSDLELKRVSVPIGVIGVIFEARPDALVQIACLCIKSGNMCILKGGRETEHTNKALFDVIYNAAVESGLSRYCLAQVSSHDEISTLLTCDKSVDLIIPRGSNEFVKYIMDNTQIPVLGHADGICHMYIDESADLDLACRVAYDAKTQYPAACNAVEMLLVNRKIAGAFLPILSEKLYRGNVRIHGTKEVSEIIDCEILPEGDYKREYLDLEISVRLVDSVKEAVDHINTYGSHHTDSCVAKDDGVWEYFSEMVDSAGVYRNISTRFADGFRYGFGAEVGISTSKIHARGPVGLSGLMTYKYKITGNGNIVEDYASGKRKFNFKDLD